MGTTPDGKHIRGEKLSMKCKPAKQLTLGFSMGSPDLHGVESSRTTEELSIVSGAGTVGRIGSEVHEMESGCSGMREMD
jgi:hypothetical protein